MIYISKKSEKSVGKDTQQESSQTPDYAKQLSDLQNTISDQGKTIEQLQEYVRGSSTIITTLASDPELKTAFQGSFARQNGLSGQQPQQTTPQNPNSQPTQTSDEGPTIEAVKELKEERRGDIIRQFERDYGIDQLPKEEQAQAKQKIATYLSEFGRDVTSIPVTDLRSNLDKAYIGSVGVDKLREEGKLEGIATMRQNAQGTFGSFPSGAPQGVDQEGKLTEKQQEWVSKLRVNPDKAKKIYSEREGEDTREKGVKEE